MSRSRKEARKGICPKCGHVLGKEELNNLRSAKEPKCPKCLIGYPIVQCVPYKHKYRLVIEGPPCPYFDHDPRYEKNCH